jgi:hypothetical protein
VEASVRIAKADLVPTQANLLDGYDSFADLERACGDFCQQVNARVHRGTRRAPAEALVEEQTRLHPLPIQPFVLAFGQTRTVGSTTPMIDFETGQYSVPHTLRGEVVWVREHGEEIVVVHVGPTGPVEVARHQRTTPGSPRLDDAHFPPSPRAHWLAPRAPTALPRPSSSRSATAPSCGLPRPQRPVPAACGPRWPRRWRWPSCTARPR